MQLSSCLSASELALVVLLCRSIWQSRNEVVFQNKVTAATQLLSQVLSSLADFISATHISKHPIQTVSSCDTWTRPHHPFLMLNVDGSLHATDGKRGLGAILRDENGDLLLACS